MGPEQRTFLQLSFLWRTLLSEPLKLQGECYRGLLFWMLMQIPGVGTPRVLLPEPRALCCREGFYGGGHSWNVCNMGLSENKAHLLRTFCVLGTVPEPHICHFI